MMERREGKREMMIVEIQDFRISGLRISRFED
jgi:hypothetical protein